MIDKKPIVASEVVTMMFKIMKHKLIGPNYLDLSKIRIYLRSMINHLDKEPPTSDSKE